MATIFSRHAVSATARATTKCCRPAPSTRGTLLASKALLPVTQRHSFSQSLQCLKRRYTESHEWIDVASDGKTCRIGISKYAAEALGDVVYVEVPEVGDETVQGEAFGAIESVKSASDIVAPVSGTVVATNEPIVEKPADVGKDPEGEGWLIEVETLDPSPVEELMDEEAYSTFTANQ